MKKINYSSPFRGVGGKTLTLILFTFCFGLCAVAQNRENEEPFLVKSLSGTDIRKVFVETSGGSIYVDGNGGSSPKIEVYVHGNNDRDLSKDEIKKRMDEYYELNISTDDHELKATVKSKKDAWFGNHSLSVSFKIYVPGHVTTDLNTSGGSIRIANLQGEERFSTSGGSLRVEKVTGNIKGSTSGGSINVSDSKETIDLSTSGGSITAMNCEGNIKLSTSGGSLHLDHLKGKIDAGTSGGSIKGSDIEGDLNTGTSGGSIDLSEMACSLKASTSGGSIHAQIKKLGDHLKLDASSGHVDLELSGAEHADLDIEGERVTATNLPHFDGQTEKDHMVGKINGGGKQVVVRASSGHANIKFD